MQQIARIKIIVLLLNIIVVLFENGIKILWCYETFINKIKRFENNSPS